MSKGNSHEGNTEKEQNSFERKNIPGSAIYKDDINSFYSTSDICIMANSSVRVIFAIELKKMKKGKEKLIIYCKCAVNINTAVIFLTRAVLNKVLLSCTFNIAIGSIFQQLKRFIT